MSFMRERLLEMDYMFLLRTADKWETVWGLVEKEESPDIFVYLWNSVLGFL